MPTIVADLHGAELYRWVFSAHTRMPALSRSSAPEAILEPNDCFRRPRAGSQSPRTDRARVTRRSDDAADGRYSSTFNRGPRECCEGSFHALHLPPLRGETCWKTGTSDGASRGDL